MAKGRWLRSISDRVLPWRAYRRGVLDERRRAAFPNFTATETHAFRRCRAEVYVSADNAAHNHEPDDLHTLLSSALSCAVLERMEAEDSIVFTAERQPDGGWLHAAEVEAALRRPPLPMSDYHFQLYGARRPGAGQ